MPRRCLTDADAVVMNVTADAPTTVGYLTVNPANAPLVPTGMLDTRTGLGNEAKLPGPRGPAARRPPLLPAAVVGRRANAETSTAAGPTGTTFLMAYMPREGGRPDTSNLNPAANENTANAVVVRPGANGYVVVWSERGEVDIVIDVVGLVPDGTP